MRDFIDRDEALKVMMELSAVNLNADYTDGFADGYNAGIRDAEPKKEDFWSAVRTMLNELERRQEKLYADYCDATARLKSINKIVESGLAPKQKIEGIKPLAELEVSE